MALARKGWPLWATGFLRKLAPAPAFRDEPDKREEPFPAENTKWDKTEAERFLKEHVKSFARYRELPSGLEITPDQLS